MTHTIDWTALNRLTEAYALRRCAPGLDSAVFVAARIRLSEVVAEMSAALGGPSRTTPFLHIYADTLVADEAILPARSTVIVARRIESEGEPPVFAAPDPAAGDVAAIQVLTQTVDGGTLTLTTISGDPSVTPLSGDAPTAVRFVSGEGAAADASAAGLLDLTRHPLSWNALKAGFEAAAELSGKPEGRETALAMLRWIYGVGSVIGGEDGPFQREAVDLSQQAAAMLLMMGAEGGAPYVPVLSRDFYANQLAGLLAEIKALEDRAADLRARADVAAAVRDVASAMHDVGGADIAPIQTAFAGVGDEVAALTKQYDAIRWQLELQQMDVAALRTDLKIALEQKLFWDKVKLAFDLIEAVIGVVVTVGALVAAPEGAAIPAKKTLDAFDGALQQLNGKIVRSDGDTGPLVRIKEAAATIGAAGEDMAKLQKAIAGVAKAGGALWKAADKAKSTFPKTARAPEFDAPDWAEIATMDPVLEWNLFLDKVEVGLKGLVDQNISGAQAYLSGLRSLAEYGKALNGKAIAIARLQSRALELSAQLRAAQFAEDRWAALSDQSADDEERRAALLALLRQRALSARRALLVGARAYAAAYRYRWLSDPAVSVSLQMDHAELLRQFNRIEAGLGELLAAGGPDQDFDTGEIVLRIVHPDETADRNGGDVAVLATPPGGAPTISFAASIDRPFFEGMLPRDGNLAVFIEKGWFYLDGVEPNSAGRVILKVGTSGQYQNGYGDKGDRSAFAAAPSRTQELDFIYEQRPDGARSDPDAGGPGTPWAPAQEVAAYYMNPAPFTLWTIRIMGAGDIRRLKAVSVRFKGRYHPAKTA